MSGNAGPSIDGTPQHGHVVSGSTFDGEPYQIALETTEVARGASGKIFRGRMQGTLPWIVAVKVIPGLMDPVLDALLARELRAARAVSVLHPYILPFLGTADVGGRTGIVSVFMDNGNLKQYINTHWDCDKKKLIVQAAEAVSFLHATMGLVHGDIKCENVLISSLGDALLADFGLSTFAEKSLGATATMTAIRGMNTLQFAAPEPILDEPGGTFPSKSRESDVYAFGMLVLEALSGDLPWPKHGNAAVMHKVCSGKQPARPTSDGQRAPISHSWWQTCQSCWSFNPHERPPITNVLSTLKGTEPSPSSFELPVNKAIEVAAYRSDGRKIVAAGFGAVVLFDTTSHHIRLLQQQDPSWNSVSQLAVSPNGRHVAYSLRNTLRVLDASSGRTMTSVQLDSIVACIAYSRDGTCIASSTIGGTVSLWDVATGAPIEWHLSGNTDSFKLSFSADGSRVASASQKGTIRVWSSAPVTTLLLATLERQTSGDWNPSLLSMEMSPDGMHIASGHNDGKLVVWDVPGARMLHTFDMRSHISHLAFSPSGMRSHYISHLAFSPSGRYVAAGAEDGVIRIWDVQGGGQVGAMTGSSGAIRSVMFSPDGKSILSTAGGSKVRVWTLSEWMSESALLYI